MKALITGICGQDGSYLAELLLEKGYDVAGIARRTSSLGTARIAHILDKLTLYTADLADSTSLEHVLHKVRPDEVYNLAAQSYVAASFSAPLHTADVTGLGALRVFEAVRNVCPKAKIYHASSSEMYGNTKTCPQNETTPFDPCSPYGTAKVFAHYCAQVYREAYDLFIACGINFNHESPRRGEDFVTRKITKAVAKIKAGEQSVLRLGNLYAKRDWSHAKDVMEAAWQMLQQPQPDDFVIASGESHSVLEFVETACNYAGLNYSSYLVTDPDLYRPMDIGELKGDSQKARRVLGWTPKYTFADLVRDMVDHDEAETLHHHSLSSV